MLASKAESTIRTCLTGFKRWKLGALSNCFCHMPANSFHVAAYLQCLIFEANSPSPALNAVYSIDWAQRLAGLPKVSDHPIASSMVSASQRILGKPNAKKEPITSEMLKGLVTSRISDKSSFQWHSIFSHLRIYIFRIVQDRPLNFVTGRGLQSCGRVKTLAPLRR